MLPRRLQKEPRFNAPKRVRSPSHLAWVRGFECVVSGCPNMPIEAHHVRLGSHAGIGQKPGDDVTVSLCVTHHREVHLGEATFQKKYGLNLLSLAAEFANASPKLRGKK